MSANATVSGKIVVMGVSGCGKTAVGQALAHGLACPFYDGDDFHPVANVRKMAQGIPLTDADRRPWLDSLHHLLAEHTARGETAVLACSALKKSYRDHLRLGNEPILFVHLVGDFDLIWQRLQARSGHYMKAAMLQSQFAALESPDPTEALTVAITQPVAKIVQEILLKAGK